MWLCAARNGRAALRLLRSGPAMSLDLLSCSPPSTRTPRLADASISHKPILSYLAFYVFVPRATVPVQTRVWTQREHRLVACAPQHASRCRCSGAGSVAPAQAPRVCCEGNFCTSEDIRNGTYYSSKSRSSAGTGTEGSGGRRNKGRNFSTTRVSQSNEDAENSDALPWPSVFHPLLEGLPQALLNISRLKPQPQPQVASSRSRVRISTKAAASSEAFLAGTESADPPVAGTPAYGKPRGTLYVIHTFNLHPYEATVFEEALYRFLGQRAVNDRRRVSAAAAPEECRTEASAANILNAQSGDLRDNRDASRGDVCVSELRDSAKMCNSLQRQPNHGVSQTVSQERQALREQSTNWKERSGQFDAVQQQDRQQQYGQSHAQQTASVPWVACAFLHHPPCRPACVHTTTQEGPGSVRKSELPYPPQAIVFGLSGQPAACVRDPETVLQQQKALFIKRFSGGGTVVRGSEDECFCVGLLLPHTFLRRRPYPRELFDVCTSLYLGENIWEKQWCASTDTQEPPVAAMCFTEEVAAVAALKTPPGRDSLLKGTGAVADRQSFSTEARDPSEGSTGLKATARDVEPEAAAAPRREAALNAYSWDPCSSTLAALSPFDASRWGFLENDYVVVYPASNLTSATSSATATPHTCVPSPVVGSHDGTESCCPSVTCSRTIAKRPTASNRIFLPAHVGSTSQAIFKVGGNAQALSRQYGLQHTSFVWDEGKLQGDLKDLLLLPVKQPKYRNNRPHIGFLRSVREGLKSHVRVAPQEVTQQLSEDSERGISIPFAERQHDLPSGRGFAGPDRRPEHVASFPLDTPSRVLLSLGLLLEGHVLSRNIALRLRRRHCEDAPGPKAAECARHSEENFGDRRDCGFAENLRRSSGCRQAATGASMERAEVTEKRLQYDEEEWDCVHCVVSPDNKIPTEFKRLWDDIGRLAHYKSIISSESEARKEERVQSSTAVNSSEDIVGTPEAKGFFDGQRGERDRRFHVLPIEAVRDLVYELFKGSLKGMRSTRLIDARGRPVLEKAYSSLFELNRIVPT